MVKDGALGHLEVLNIAIYPEKARALGVASAPWTKIGIFELTGSYSEKELRNWARLAETSSGIGNYFSHLLENREMGQLIKTIIKHPDTLSDLLQLLEDIETTMAVRIGIGAAVEELQEQDLLSQAIPKLIELTMSSLPQVRADACHYLGLTGNPLALPAVQNLLMDKNMEVREIAGESLALLGQNE
jgi:hypothetical protein